MNSDSKGTEVKNPVHSEKQDGVSEGKNDSYPELPGSTEALVLNNDPGPGAHEPSGSKKPSVSYASVMKASKYLLSSHKYCHFSQPISQLKFKKKVLVDFKSQPF